MTVRIHTAPLKHPSACDVCGGTRRVKARSVRRWRLPQPGGGLVLEEDSHAAKFAVLVPCPQCAGAGNLLRLLRPVLGGGPRASA